MKINNKVCATIVCLVSFWQGCCANQIVPQEVVAGLLKDYTAQEQDRIKDDLSGIRALTFRGLTRSSSPQYIATAGGPGAGKSTILETYVHDHKIDNLAYIDPDQRALRFMVNTYYQDLNLYEASRVKSYQDLLVKGYEKWRGGSNYIANTLLNEAVDKGFSIMHGTTSTGEAMDQLYDKLKTRGYEITVLVCASSVDNRQRALSWRAKDQGFVQSDPEDVVTKGKALFDRFPVYFSKADHVLVYWTSDYSKGARLVARFDKGKGVKVLHKDLSEVEKLYEEVRAEKADKHPHFQELLSRAR